MILFRALILVLITTTFTGAFSQIPTPANESASPALTEHFFQETKKWVEGVSSNGLNSTPGISVATAQAMRDTDFLQTRNQIRQLGIKAWPIAPKIAELLVRNTAKQYELAWMLYDMTPTVDAGESTVALIRAKYDNPLTLPAEKLVLLSQLGKVQHPVAVKMLGVALSNADVPTRLMITVAMGGAGKADASAAAQLLASQLKDSERFTRTAAANAIRLIGRPAAAASPALGEYLRSRENVYMACAALKDMPIEAIRPLKAELESIVSDTKLTGFVKQEAVNLLLRIESETPPSAPRAIG
jgi:hypothetical protein